jgi:RNA polymerase sigma-70 factor (ECF subfamily)
MKPERHSDLEAFFRREYEPLCRYVCCIVGNVDDAVETVQEVFLRFYQLQQETRGGQNARALLFRLARNLAIDVVRRRRVRVIYQRQVEEGRISVRITATPEQLMLEKEQRGLAETALRRLSGTQRECLVLRSSGLSYKIIADTLGLNPESIGPTLARALRRFKVAFAELLETKTAPAEAQHARRR